MGQAPSRSHAEIQPIYQWLLWMGICVLAFVQTFVSFRGLDSQAGMEQAVVARELARGNGYKTKVIRPMSVQQALSAGAKPNLTLLPDTLQPPVQPLVWAPLFKAAPDMWKVIPNRRINLMDRALACLGVAWLLLSLAMVYYMATQLFDKVIAGFTIATLMMSQPLWQMATGGSSRVLLLFLTTLWLVCLLSLVKKEEYGDRMGFVAPLMVIGLAGLIPLTHWMGIWLVLGLVAALWMQLPAVRWLAVASLAVAVAGLVVWATRNLAVCGNPLGAFKAPLLAAITPDSSWTHLRDLSGNLPATGLRVVLFKLNSNFRDVFQNIYLLLLGSIPALLAVISLLHPFRNPAVRVLRASVFLGWLGILIGSTVMGGQSDAVGDEQIHAVLVPMLTMLGLAVLAVLWARLNSERPTLWTDYGYAFVVVAVSAWPMLSGLYEGLTMDLFNRDRLVQWPPYMPDRTAMIHDMVEPQELVMSDQPWATAWYSDRTSVALPKTKEQFAALSSMAAEQGHPIVGMVISPMSSMDLHLFNQMTGPYEPWSDQIFRTTLLGFGMDLAEGMKDRYPFKKAFPMSGALLQDGRLLPQMVFFADRDRWEGIR